jgi:hypothetical protein
MLWLGLLTRDTGIPASQRLKIRDEVLALDFDLAASLRLLSYDNDKDKANKKFWVSLVAGSEAAEQQFPDDGDEILNADVIAGDRYADSNTQVW